MGIIYLVHVPSGKKYVGQHNTENLLIRKKSHMRSYNAHYKAIREKKIPKGGSIALYNAIIEYGYDKCVWTIIENNVPGELLNSREDFHITDLNTMHPNGYNLKLNSSDTNLMYSQISLDKMSASQSKVYDTKLNNYRRNNDELKDLPKHVIFITKGNQRGYRVVDHPSCKSKDFCSSTEPLEVLKERVLKFLLEVEHTPHISDRVVKHRSGTPQGIIKKRYGYEVQFHKDDQRYSKMFTKKTTTEEENLSLAIIWLNDLKQSLNNPGTIAIPENNRANKTIPTGITKAKVGYRVAFMVNKVRYGMSFSNSQISDEDQLLLAIDWMTAKKTELDAVALTTSIVLKS